MDCMSLYQDRLGVMYLASAFTVCYPSLWAVSGHTGHDIRSYTLRSLPVYWLFTISAYLSLWTVSGQVVVLGCDIACQCIYCMLSVFVDRIKTGNSSIKLSTYSLNSTHPCGLCQIYIMMISITAVSDIYWQLSDNYYSYWSSRRLVTSSTDSASIFRLFIW